MGYANYYQVQNEANTRNKTPLKRLSGYAIEAYCDFPKCKTIIARNLENSCGENPSEKCQGFYCDNHKAVVIYADELNDYTNEELEAHGVTRFELELHFSNGESAFTVCNHKPAYFKKPMPPKKNDTEK